MKRILHIFILVLSLIFAVESAYSQNTNKVAISNVLISKNSQNISLAFDIKGAFTKEIEDAIKSGIPTPFTFIVELYRERSFWFNEKLAELKFKHIVQYDTLKAEYELIIEEKAAQDKIIKLKDLPQVKEVMSKVEGISVSISETPQKGSKYILKIKAKLDTVNLFFPLNYMLFFVSFWDFETDWHEEIIVY